SDPYYMSFFGKHLLTNGMTYLRWSLDALMPSAPPLAAAAVAFVVGAGALAAGRALAPAALRAVPRRLVRHRHRPDGGDAQSHVPLLPGVRDPDDLDRVVDRAAGDRRARARQRAAR